MKKLIQKYDIEDRVMRPSSYGEFVRIESLVKVLTEIYDNLSHSKPEDIQNDIQNLIVDISTDDNGFKIL